MTQFGRNFRDGDLRSNPDHLWSSENLGRSGERRTAEALLDDPVVLHIPVGKKSDHYERCGEKAEQRNPHDGIAGQKTAFATAFSALATTSSCRDFQRNGHGDGCASIHKAILSPQLVLVAK